MKAHLTDLEAELSTIDLRDEAYFKKRSHSDSEDIEHQARLQKRKEIIRAIERIHERRRTSHSH